MPAKNGLKQFMTLVRLRLADVPVGANISIIRAEGYLEPSTLSMQRTSSNTRLCQYAGNMDVFQSKRLPNHPQKFVLDNRWLILGPMCSTSHFHHAKEPTN